MPPESENMQAASADSAAAWFRGGRVVWLIAMAAVPQSLIAAKLLDGVIHPGSMLPGIAFLFMLMFGIGWLVLAWGLVTVAFLVPRKTMRFLILALLVLPDLWCLPILVNDTWFWMTYREPDIETGVGYFDDKAGRDLVVAVRACNPRMRQYGLVCDLDKVAALARTTDVSGPGTGGASQLELAFQNGPNPDVLRILLRAGKPPDDMLKAVLYDAIDTRDVPLLRATLDAGLDPNGLADSVTPVLFMAEFHGWAEGVATILDAGATIDQTDSAGYTVLMRAIDEAHYDVAALLLARGAAEDRVAPYGKSMETLVAKIPPEDREKLPPSVMALMDRHRPR